MSKRSTNFIKLLKKCKEEIYERKDKEAARVFLKVKEYVLDGKYSTLRVAPKLVSLMMDGLSDDCISSAFSVSESRVRVMKKQVSDELYRVFGTDFFDLLVDYGSASSKEEVDKRLCIANHVNDNICDYVPDFVISSIDACSKRVIRDISLEDCEDEICFLLKHSKKALSNEIQELEDTKLCFLLGVLNGNIADRGQERIELIQRFTQ